MLDTWTHMVTHTHTHIHTQDSPQAPTNKSSQTHVFCTGTQMSAHAWDAHGQSIGSDGGIFASHWAVFFFSPLTPLICKVDFLYPSALSPSQNIHTSIHFHCQIPLTHVLFLHSGKREKEWKKERKKKTEQTSASRQEYWICTWCLVLTAFP